MAARSNYRVKTPLTLEFLVSLFGLRNHQVQLLLFDGQWLEIGFDLCFLGRVRYPVAEGCKQNVL